MTYDITTAFEPNMPKLGKGLESINLIASQFTDDMKEALIPMVFPALGAYISGTEFQYPDRTWKEPCGMLGHLIGVSGLGKGQLTRCIEAITRKLSIHDAEELQKLVEWQKAMKSKGANKDKPVRPEVCMWFPPADVTNPAFIQNAMACELHGGHTQYFDLPEVEMADKMCGGHKQVSQTIRNIYDRQRSGALRATADGVTGNPILRVNMTLSSTPYAARRFYKNDLYVGTFGRIPFSYKPRKERKGVIPRQGEYDETFLKKIDEIIVKLEACRGRFVIPQLNRLADKMAEDMATLADLIDDDDVWDMSKRSIVNAWKNGCIMYILNGFTWTRSMSNLVEWMAYHDLWSKMQVFGDMLLKGDANTASKGGPKNMLNDLPDTFNEAQLEALRVTLDKPKDAKNQLRVWKKRGFIEYSAQTGLYTKTETYLKRTR